MVELSEFTLDCSEQTYTPYVGGFYPAADGGSYGIRILGYVRETMEFIVIVCNANGKSLQYGPQDPHRLAAIKASYRYKLV